jgi:hypothetical protein
MSARDALTSEVTLLRAYCEAVASPPIRLFPHEAPDDFILSLADAARLIPGVEVKTLRNWADTDERIPVIRIGRRVFHRLAAVAHFRLSIKKSA